MAGQKQSLRLRRPGRQRPPHHPTTPPSSIGIGAWAWGDRTGYWGFGGDYGKDDCGAAFAAALAAGVPLVDTAEAVRERGGWGGRED